MNPELVEAVEAALWALKAGRPDVAERYLLATQAVEVSR